MKQKVKQIIIMIVVFLLALTLLTPLFAMSDSEYKKFADNEEHYQKLCTNYSSDDRQLCQSFADFKKEKIARAKDDVKNAQSTISEIKDQIDKEEKNLEGYYKEIEALEVDIVANEKLVTQTEAAIRTVETQIQERQDRIEELDLLIKEFLVNMQGEMRVNGYIEFVMGARSFSDIVRRSEGMKRIKEYNEALINEVLAEQELLKEDKNNLEMKKEQLENEKQLLVVQVEKSKSLYNVIDAIVRELRIQKKIQEELVEQSTQISKAEQDSLKDIFEKIVIPPAVSGGGSTSGNMGGSASSGWIYPISGNFRTGDGVWSYGTGGKHLGQDYGASVGTTLVAPASGVILDTRGGCPTYGGYFSNCNGGWGNYLTMVVNVNGAYYGLLYAHIQDGGFLSSGGQQVSAGQAVAKVGSSGRSTGPHLHVEVFYLGQELNESLSHYTTNTFGTGGSSSERANSRCHSNGNSAPCRMNPRSVFP